MKVLIDGYNLIFAWGWMPTTQHARTTIDARARMIKKLKPLIPAEFRSRFQFVFDVKSASSAKYLQSGRESSGFEFLFATDYPDADTLIERLIKTEPSPENLIVVSSDHRIKAASKRRRVAWLNSQGFLDALPALVSQMQCDRDLNETARAADSRSKDASKARGDKIEADSSAAEKALKEIDWFAEFGITEEELPKANEKQQSNIPSELSKPSSSPMIFDLFPPGYGDDVMNDE